MAANAQVLLFCATAICARPIEPAPTTAIRVLLMNANLIGKWNYSVEGMAKASYDKL